jgi:antitoxin VapB
MVSIKDNHHIAGDAMDTARLFLSGRSQAVRLPKAFRFQGQEVAVKHFGNGVLLLPIENPWQLIEEALTEFEPNFELQRESQGEQIREELQF